MPAPYHRIGAFKDVTVFREALDGLGLSLPCDEAPLSATDGSPLAEPIDVGGFTVGNRWCVHPMEGWDGTADGKPSEHTLRRWRNFGASGCKLIWGGEAVAVVPEGRANPNQLDARPQNTEALRSLRQTLIDEHQSRFGTTDDLLLGLQLTHSGRFCRPHRKDRIEPRIAYRHPLLDQRAGITDDSPVLSDGEIPELIERYIAAAKMAQSLGFQFVDIKHCHGYLGHEFLSAFTRPGPYGGDLDGRTRFLREIIEGIRTECPGLAIGVRISVFDRPPYHPDPEHRSGGKLGPGIPDEFDPRDYPAFGCDRNDPMQIDLSEPIELLRRLADEYDVTLINATAGSPYYNPHIQRPAFYPPSDGYQPPEDPLVGCVRQIDAVRDLKHVLPQCQFVGTAYTYFQEFLPHVAQAVIREGWTDFVGIGRLILSDWELPSKVLRGEDYAASKTICRTFSDCTTGPRGGLISGCYPLDEYYKSHPEAAELKQIKAAVRERMRMKDEG